MKIGSKISLGLAIMVLIVLSAGLFTAVATIRMNAAVFRLLRHHIPATEALNLFMVAFNEADARYNRYRRLREAENLDSLKLQLRTLEETITACAEQPFVEGDEILLEELRESVATYVELVDRAVRSLEASNLREADEISRSEIAAQSHIIRSQVGQLIQRYHQHLETRELRNLDLGAMLSTVAVGFGILGTLVAAILALVGQRIFLGPLRSLVRSADAIAKGDLAHRTFSGATDEFGDLARSFNQMAGSLDDRIRESKRATLMLGERNAELLTARDVISQELEFARHIQSGMLPRSIRVPGAEVFAQMQAAREIGGDFYDFAFYRGENSRLGVTIGDVSGRGIPAALLMVLAVSVLREAARQTDLPCEVLGLANAAIRGHFQERDFGMFVSACHLFLDPKNGVLRYAKAGHEDIVWWRKGEGKVRILGARGLFLGCFEDGGYEDVSVQLAPGDKIILHTDGIVEARDTKGEMFGHDRFLQLVERWGDLPPHELGSRIISAVNGFRGGGALADDMAIVILEFNGNIR